MNLIDELRAFDGKRTAVLEQLSATMPRDAASVAQLIEIAERVEREMQVGATWILKRWCEEGESQIEGSVARLTRLLQRATYWEAQLHLLQILTSLRIPARSLPSLKKRLSVLMRDENKLVRAWSLSVFAAIGDQDVALRGEVESVLSEAEHDEAASVRARVRQIRKAHPWSSRSGRARE